MSTKDTPSRTREYQKCGLTREMVLKHISIQYWTKIDEVCRGLQRSSLINNRNENTKTSVRTIIKNLISINLVEVKGTGKGTVYRRIQPHHKRKVMTKECKRIIDDAASPYGKNGIPITRLVLIPDFTIDLIGMYMQISTFKFESAREISKKTGVPLASIYRRIKVLNKLDMIIMGERELTREGKRYSMYKRRYVSILIDDNATVHFVERLYS